MSIITIEQGTEPWHQWRSKGIGASESPALFNESPYFTRREVWLTKKKLIPLWFIDQGNDYIFDKGHEFEEKMRAEYFAMTGEEFSPLCVANSTYPFIIASLDGRFGRKNFEAKLVSTEVKNEIAMSGKPPRHHWIQIQHQFLADGEAGVCIYFAHDLAGEAVVVEVFPDPLFMISLRDELLAFQYSIENNEEPPMTKDDFHFSDNDDAFQELILIKAAKDEADKKAEFLEVEYKTKLKAIADSSPHHNVASINKAVKIKLMNKPGFIKYTDIPEVKALSPEYLSVFRGEGTSYFQAWFPKQKAKA